MWKENVWKKKRYFCGGEEEWRRKRRKIFGEIKCQKQDKSRTNAEQKQNKSRIKAEQRQNKSKSKAEQTQSKSRKIDFFCSNFFIPPQAPLEGGGGSRVGEFRGLGHIMGF